MTVHPRELCSRLALLAALFSALVPAGCGVKGGLEPPPAPQAAAAPPSGAPSAGQKSDQFVLDPLL